MYHIRKKEKEVENEEQIEEENKIDPRMKTINPNMILTYIRKEILNKDLFYENEILDRAQYYLKCSNQMILDNNHNYMDNKVWGWRTKLNNHELKEL